MIHIGNGVSLFEEDIVAILNIETLSKSKDTKLFIDSLIEGGALVNNLNKNIKSYIVCLKNEGTNVKDKNRYKLYLSNISSDAIVKRINTYGQDWRKVNGQ